MFDSADGEGKGAAAMGESYPQLWEAGEDASENHRANRQRSFGGHADEPGQPVIRHSLLPRHVPGVNENRGTELFGGTPDWLERGIVQIQSVKTAAMLICVDMGTDLRAAQAAVADAAVESARGEA